MCGGVPCEGSDRPAQWWHTALLWLGFIGWCVLVVSLEEAKGEHVQHTPSPCEIIEGR